MTATDGPQVVPESSQTRAIAFLYIVMEAGIHSLLGLLASLPGEPYNK